MPTDPYTQLTDRNIGLLTDAQQQALKDSSVAVFGVGGLGGVIAEILARAGVGTLKIADNDRFDPTNLNRQIFAFRDTIGRSKVAVTEKFLKKINPGLKVEIYNIIAEENIDRILSRVSVALLAVDTTRPCLIISRACRRLGIPLVEGWAIPFGNVRVFTKNTPSLEETYGFPTAGKAIKDIREEDMEKMRLEMLETLTRFEGLKDFYPPLAIERIKAGRIPSFAPLVWLTAVLMSLEAVKALLGWGTLAAAPRFALYDPFKGVLPSQEGPTS
jgi:molybdopterin/thiamine biosynthesis adenylyltransferase